MAQVEITLDLWDGVPTADIVGENDFEGVSNEIRLKDIGPDTKMLAHLTGANDSRLYPDEFGNDFTPIPTSDNDIITTAITDPYGGSAGVMDLAGAADAVRAFDNAAFNIANISSVIQVEARFDSTVLMNLLQNMAPGFKGGGYEWYFNPPSSLIFTKDNVTPIITRSFTPSTGTWYAFALKHDISTNEYSLWVDGVQLGSTQVTTTQPTYLTGGLILGGRYNPSGGGSQWFNGQMANFRIVHEAIAVTNPTGYYPAATYSSSSPSPNGSWKSLDVGDQVLWSTFFAPEYIASVLFHVATNGSALGPALTQTQVRALAPTTITDATQSVQVVPALTGDGTQNTGVEAKATVTIERAPASCDYPATTDVRDGVSYDFGGQTGVYEPADPSKYEIGEQYGANGTEFTGTARFTRISAPLGILPSEDDIQILEVD
jgi:hypothetical protein